MIWSSVLQGRGMIFHKQVIKINPKSSDKMLIVLLMDLFTIKAQHKPDLNHISI